MTQIIKNGKALTVSEIIKESGFSISPIEMEKRLENLCDCKHGGSFDLLPETDPAVISGGKRYMQCRVCGCWSHL